MQECRTNSQPDQRQPYPDGLDSASVPPIARFQLERINDNGSANHDHTHRFSCMTAYRSCMRIQALPFICTHKVVRSLCCVPLSALFATLTQVGYYLLIAKN